MTNRYMRGAASLGAVLVGASVLAAAPANAAAPSPCAALSVTEGAHTVTYSNNCTFTVPAGVHLLRVEVKGAAGGGTASVAGGKGAAIKAAIMVGPGQQLGMFVG